MLFQQSIELKFILLLFRLPVGLAKDLYATIADAPPCSFPYDIILLSNCDITLTRPRSTGDNLTSGGSTHLSGLMPVRKLVFS